MSVAHAATALGGAATSQRGALVFAGLLAAGCGTPLPPPGLDVGGGHLVVVTQDPVVVIDGVPGGKVGGAGVGAMTGLGAGVVVAGTACALTGPAIALCLAVVLPSTAVGGTVAGAVAGGLRSETTDANAAKRALLSDELVARSYPTLLAEHLRSQAREDFATPWPLSSPAPAEAASTASAPSSAAAATAATSRPVAEAPSSRTGLRIEVAMTEIGTEGKRSYALRLVARLRLFRPGEALPAHEMAREVQSETDLATAAWAADGGKALRGVLDICLRQVARRLLVDLVPPAADAPAAARRRGGKYSTSCNDVPEDWEPAATPVGD